MKYASTVRLIQKRMRWPRSSHAESTYATMHAASAPLRKPTSKGVTDAVKSSAIIVNMSHRCKNFVFGEIVIAVILRSCLR